MLTDQNKNPSIHKLLELQNELFEEEFTLKEYNDYMNFITIEEEAIVDIAYMLKDISEQNKFDEVNEINFIMSFVQALKYTEDNVSAGVGEYPKFPIETLVDQSGDCEDSAALLISILEVLNYEAALILIPEAWDGYGHRYREGRRGAADLR